MPHLVGAVRARQLVLLGWFVGLARAATALMLQVAINLVNLVVTTLLVLWFGFGVTGAALGALVAEAAGTIAGLALALRVVGVRLPRPAQVSTAPASCACS